MLVPTGAISFTSAPNDLSGPLFLTVTVYVTVVPEEYVFLPSVLFICKSAQKGFVICIPLIADFLITHHVFIVLLSPKNG